MSDCDHMCTKCDEKSCIEFKPKMAFPRELQTDYEMMITANLLMAASIESSKRKNDQLQAENAKLREERDHWHVEQVHAYGNWEDAHKRATELEAENAKLREHLNELLMIGSFNGSCRRDCRYMDDCLADRFGQPDCFVCQELQELGIEA